MISGWLQIRPIAGVCLSYHAIIVLHKLPRIHNAVLMEPLTADRIASKFEVGQHMLPMWE